MAIMTEEEMRAIYRDAEEPMMFVRREAGIITCAWANWSPDATEILAEAHADVVAFRAATAPLLEEIDRIIG